MHHSWSIFKCVNCKDCLYFNYIIHLIVTHFIFEIFLEIWAPDGNMRNSVNDCVNFSQNLMEGVGGRDPLFLGQILWIWISLLDLLPLWIIFEDWCSFLCCIIGFPFWCFYLGALLYLFCDVFGLGALGRCPYFLIFVVILLLVALVISSRSGIIGECCGGQLRVFINAVFQVGDPLCLLGWGCMGWQGYSGRSL